jgi:NAD(P)H-hydrate repair Nnr-like enzyme with NAD(P)H-hydrate epimerase domain
MISGYTTDDVRAAEAPLLARGVPLMQHAAFALATRVAAELGARRAGTPGGAVRGASVVLLVGSGSNGGDALHAGALLARRGARVLAVCTTGSPHAEGLAALRRAGGRAVRVTDTVVDAAGVGRHRQGPDPVAEAGAATDGGPAPVWVGDAVAEAYAADVVLDGLLGIGGRGAPRGVAELLVGLLRDLLAEDGPARVHGAADGAAGRRGPTPGPLVVAVDLPSGIGVDDGTLPDGPVLPADVTVTFGGSKAGLLPPGRCRWSTSGCRSTGCARRWPGWGPRTWRGSGRCRGPTRTSTAGACWVWSPARPPTRGPRCWRCPRRRSAGSGWCGTSGHGRSATRCSRHGRRW